MVLAVDAQGITKRYRRTTAVDGVDLSVEPGEIVGVLGRNGVGKTTLVETIAGLRRPDDGTVRVLGVDPFVDALTVRRSLGVQLQQDRFHGALTVSELVALFRSFYSSGERPRDLIQGFGLADSSRIRFDDLSGGQQRRLSIAIALIGRPQVVIVDEPTAGLDPESRRRIWDRLRALSDDGVAIILVSHQMDEVARLCDRAVILRDGRRVAAGPPAAIIDAAGRSSRSRSSPMSLDDAFIALTEEQRR